ncbi:MAG: hypothetical protein RLZZ244_2033, partial [Verrucomicrobiota bacterium]
MDFIRPGTRICRRACNVKKLAPEVCVLSRSFFNTIRQKIADFGPDGKSTGYAWCSCGSLSKLTDPAGRVTEWKRDIEGRVTEK